MSREIGFLAGALAALALTTAPAFAWEPSKPVEIVVAAGAGGASDQMARMMQAAIQKKQSDEAADSGVAQGRCIRRRSLDVHEVQRRRSEQGADRLFADLHVAAVGKDSVQLARAHSGVGGRAGPVRAVGQCLGAEKRKGIRRGRESRKF